MKENKFRGKRLDNGFWVYGYYVFCRKRHYILPYIEEKIGFDERYQEWIEVDPATVGQYTGLKDSKRTEEYPEGQEIYEGDKTNRGIVEYWKGTFMIIQHNDQCWDNLCWCHNKIEVIGNVWEDGGLLNDC